MLVLRIPPNDRRKTLAAVVSCARSVAEGALRGEAAGVAMLPYAIVGLQRALAAELADDPELLPGVRADLLLRATSLAECGPSQITVAAGRLLAFASLLGGELGVALSPVSPPGPPAG